MSASARQDENGRWGLCGELRSPGSEEELATLPAHMRQPVVCEGQVVSFLLEVVIDGATAVRDTIRPAGVRADRPLYVFSELRVGPGDHAVRVSFRSLGRRQESKEYDLETRIQLAPREVVLVTLDADGARLVVRAGSAS